MALQLHLRSARSWIYTISFLASRAELSYSTRARWALCAIRKYLRLGLAPSWIYIDITAALRAVLNIARACACNILYLHEGASPRRRYFRIARRAQRARVLYDSSALMARNDIVYIHKRAFITKLQFPTITAN